MWIALAIPPVAPEAQPSAGFGGLDWLVVGAYLAALAIVGAWTARRTSARTSDRDDFFLAGRSIPGWAVAISVVATATSAATFIGGPQQAYVGDLRYLSASLGGIVASILIATIFIPAFYRHRVTSIYEVLGHAQGPGARRMASAMFMGGRLLASGARLYIVALPFSLVVFGRTDPVPLAASIAIVALVATTYTAFGGIRTVIWTDVLQAAVLVITVSVAIVVAWRLLPFGFTESVEHLRAAADGDKLRLFDLRLDLTSNYTVWTALIGFTCFNLAAFGTDQDLTQRLLTCRSARSASRSIIASQFIAIGVSTLFLGIGLLLYLYYQSPDLLGADAPSYGIDDTRAVFLEFILHEMPAGLRGLMIAGLFAAAMSSMDSALNALAATTIVDFGRGGDHRVGPSRIAIVVWGAALALTAVVCMLWHASSHAASGTTLIDFALGIMVYAYGGLLGVFLVALLTRRGNSASAGVAMAFGVVLVWWLGRRHDIGWFDDTRLVYTPIAFPWRMAVTTLACFLICVSGRRREPPVPATVSA